MASTATQAFRAGRGSASEGKGVDKELDLLYLVDRLALVEATARADAVRHLGLVAVWTEAQARGLKVIVGATAVASSLGVTALGIGHVEGS
jgi:hypothetical protein